MSPADKLLSRLERVKPRPGGQFFACCPAHDDKTPSLSIREVEDGRVLVYCFAGCRAEEICAAVGLEMRDLFPGDGLQKSHQANPRINPRDLLALLATESNVVYLAAGMLSTGEPLSMQDHARLEAAWQRIAKITGVAHVS